MSGRNLLLQRHRVKLLKINTIYHLKTIQNKQILLIILKMQIFENIFSNALNHIVYINDSFNNCYNFIIIQCPSMVLNTTVFINRKLSLKYHKVVVKYLWYTYITNRK